VDYAIMSLMVYGRFPQINHFFSILNNSQMLKNYSNGDTAITSLLVYRQLPQINHFFTFLFFILFL